MILRISITLLLAVARCDACAANLVVFDVGEGQSILLADRDDAVLIDTGNPANAKRVIEALKGFGISRLSAVILTHLHDDHTGGWFRISEEFPGAQVIYSGHDVPALSLSDTSRWVLNAIKIHPKYKELKWLERINVGSCTAEVISPIVPLGTDLNENSLVFAVSCGGAHALLMADAGISVEQNMMRNEIVKHPVTLLVVGHHGSAGGSSKEFLKHLRPKYSVISVNSNNVRGYPARATIETLEEFSQYVFRTDRQGTMVFCTGAEGAWELC